MVIDEIDFALYSVHRPLRVKLCEFDSRVWAHWPALDLVCAMFDGLCKERFALCQIDLLTVQRIK